ncbi:energy-coupling factor transporter transmembrane component T family protein [Kocuria rosea]|uniref:Energy-coupling factor transporter transmembrane protein EcfT n=1 Tax=Kocuria rosea TaxID=1275 RepID=A0A4R5YDE6_KOCRO|nr:energy-coupling factor transporter transmembrane protein EcfT [Kocuria rosea]TDL42775.1 energy-coupling factor transporter transmembrane protein EcfT [Kocuria rosea]
MSRGPDLFGSYSPGTGLLHRAPLRVKGLGIVAVTLAVVLSPSWPVPAALTLLLLVAGSAAGIGALEWWRGLAPALPVLVLLAVYHVLTSGPAQAADVVLTIVVLLVLTRVLMHTTPLPDLLDGVVWLCSPVRLVGADPERIGLAISLMLRSIPFIVGAVGELRDAVRARGLRPNPVRLVTPAVISAVAYAQRTGEALAARGFD